MTPTAFKAQTGVSIENTTNAIESTWYNGTVDPSVAPGVKAPVSSIYTRNINGTDAYLYQKFGPNDTDWTRMASGTSNGVIGTAEDGTYVDGLFTDFVPSTQIGVAVDRFNEVLKALCPQPAPVLDYISVAQTGVSAKLSFGATHGISGYTNVTAAAGNSVVDINGTYTQSGTRLGAFVPATKSGTLNDDISANGQNWTADSFGPGDQGTVNLEVNGTVVKTVDLSSFASGSSLNANGSGFTLSASTSVKFPDGTALDLFKFRTGTWTVAVADQRNGFNYVKVIHTVSGSNTVTGYYEWVNDPDNNAMTATSGTLNQLAMTGSKYLSGVQYHTGGTAKYSVTINNAYHNVYSPSATAISYTCTFGSISSQAIPNCTAETDTVVLTDKTFTITSGIRLLNQAIASGVNCLHPLKSSLSNGSNQTITGLLMDNIDTANTDLVENFCLENYRIPSVGLASVNGYAVQADVASTWTSSTSIANESTNGYKDGLLVYSGTVRYPTQGLNSGNFSTAASNGPAGNPDYSTAHATGTRYFYRKFRNTTGATKANFKINIAGSSTTFAAASGLSGNNVSVEMKFPTGSLSTSTGWMDCYGDFATAQWSDGNGARNATAGAGRALSTDWGLTVGTKSIAANEYVVIRIAAPAAWTGSISSITLTWL